MAAQDSVRAETLEKNETAGSAIEQGNIEFVKRFDEKFVNFLGAPISIDRCTANGWLRILSQKDLDKALDCEDMPEYAEGIFASLPGLARKHLGILGRVARANPALLELFDEISFANAPYIPEIVDHHSCDEYGVAGAGYPGCRNRKFVPHDEAAPDLRTFHAVYRLRRRSPSVKSAKAES